jgi:hypothetical protein
MLSQIAQVFSSNGVVLPGTEFVPVRSREEKRGEADGKLPECGHGAGCTCGKTRFDQDSAKVEFSKAGRDKAAESGSSDGPGKKDAAGKTLNEDEKKQVDELKKRDTEVRRHEQQHMSSAGGYVKGGANFEYQQGPDGKSYAVGGHVSIDASPVDGDPQATLTKAQTVQRAALAPADPSGQDRAVAAAAAQMAIEAQKQIAEKTREGGDGSGHEPGAPESGPESQGLGKAGKDKARQSAEASAQALIADAVAGQDAGDDGQGNVSVTQGEGSPGETGGSSAAGDSTGSSALRGYARGAVSAPGRRFSAYA